MRSPPLPSSTNPEQIREMFDAIAPSYDRLNHWLSMGVDLRWRRLAAQALRLQPGERAADLCAGTLDMSVALRRAGAQVIALDFSHPMLRAGEKKAANHGIARVQADAMRLPLTAASAEAVTVAFGIRNVRDTGACLREIARILKPGGRLAILEFAPPRGISGSLFNFYFRQILPRIGGWVSGHRAAYRYLPESVANYLAPEQFLELVEAAGLSEAKATAFFPGVALLYTACKPS